MISVSNIKRACLAALDRQVNVQDGGEEPAGKLLELVQYFQPPEFYLENNMLGFYTGADCSGSLGKPLMTHLATHPAVLHLPSHFLNIFVGILVPEST